MLSTHSALLSKPAHYDAKSSSSLVTQLSRMEGIETIKQESNLITGKYNSFLLDFRDISRCANSESQTTLYIEHQEHKGQGHFLLHLAPSTSPLPQITKSEETDEEKSLAVSLKHNFKLASSEKYTVSAIHEIKPGLKVSSVCDDHQQKIYLGFEDLSATPHGLQQWDMFYGHTAPVSFDFKKALDTSSTTNQFQFFQSTLLEDYSFDSIQSELKDISQSKSYAKTITTLEGIPYGTGGRLFRHNDSGHNQKYIIYASTKPITDFTFTSANRIYNFDQYAYRMGHIAMCVTASSNGTNAIHRGIIKPPISAVNHLEAHLSSYGCPKGGLSMLTHSFGMACFKSMQVQYLSFSPVQSMFNILNQSELPLQRYAVFMGNEAIEQANLTQAKGPSCSSSNPTLREIPIVIDLSKLKNLFWKE